MFSLLVSASRVLNPSEDAGVRQDSFTLVCHYKHGDSALLHVRRVWLHPSAFFRRADIRRRLQPPCDSIVTRFTTSTCRGSTAPGLFIPPDPTDAGLLDPSLPGPRSEPGFLNLGSNLFSSCEDRKILTPSCPHELKISALPLFTLGFIFKSNLRAAAHGGP